MRTGIRTCGYFDQAVRHPACPFYGSIRGFSSLQTSATWDANRVRRRPNRARAATRRLRPRMPTATPSPLQDRRRRTRMPRFRPTSFYDYDAFDNVAAFCDGNEARQANGQLNTPATSDWLLLGSHYAAVRRLRSRIQTSSPVGQGSRQCAFGGSRGGSRRRARTGQDEFSCPRRRPRSDRATQPLNSNARAGFRTALSALHCYGKGTASGASRSTQQANPLFHRRSRQLPPEDGESVCRETGVGSNWIAQQPSASLANRLEAGDRKLQQRAFQRGHDIIRTSSDGDNRERDNSTTHYVPNQTYPGGTTKIILRRSGSTPSRYVAARHRNVCRRHRRPRNRTTVTRLITGVSLRRRRSAAPSTSPEHQHFMPTATSSRRRRSSRTPAQRFFTVPQFEHARPSRPWNTACHGDRHGDNANASYDSSSPTTSGSLTTRRSRTADRWR